MTETPLVFTQPAWLGLAFAVSSLLVLARGLQGEAKPGYWVGVFALAFGAAQVWTSYARGQARGASQRSMFIRQTITWRDIASAEVVHRTGGGGVDTLELKDASGQREVHLVLGDLGRERGAAIAQALFTRLPPALAPQARVVAEKTAR